MTKPPETHTAPSAAAAKHGGHRLLPPARYRHPGDMIRLIIAGLVLAVALAVTAVTHATYAGAGAVAVSAVAPATLAGRVLGGVVHALFAAAAVAAFLVTLRYHRYRLLGGLAVAAVVASGIVIGIIYLAGGERPRALAAGAGPWSWLTGALAAAALAAAPTPGGLGPLEAALVSLLTGVGMAAGPAFSAVLLYRLATYWLPVAPGWLSWRVLQRREYV